MWLVSDIDEEYVVPSFLFLSPYLCFFDQVTDCNIHGVFYKKVSSRMGARKSGTRTVSCKWFKGTHSNYHWLFVQQASTSYLSSSPGAIKTQPSNARRSLWTKKTSGRTGVTRESCSLCMSLRVSSVSSLGDLPQICNGCYLDDVRDIDCHH